MITPASIQSPRMAEITVATISRMKIALILFIRSFYQ